MTTTPEVAGVAIVLAGSFNPAIFQPAWFATQELIRSDEAESADIKLIHPEIAAFSSGPFELQVTRDQFLVTTTQEPYEVVRDLTLGAFSLLVHTPVRAIGINRHVHVKQESEEEWHALGHRLVPPSEWKGILLSPGLQSLTEQGQRPDDWPGYVQVRVEPSKQVNPFGVFVLINDHFQLDVKGDPGGAKAALDVLAGCWDDSLVRAETIISGVLKGEK